MPSRSHSAWITTRAGRLDQIAAAHAAVGGAARGRRFATQQINYAYALLLSSEFQGFCRDLHTEATNCIVAAVTPTAVQTVLLARLTENRKLDHGNANGGNLGSDFGRFGMALAAVLDTRDRHNVGRRADLDVLGVWRNAIAHQDFTPAALKNRTNLRLQEVQAFRRACNVLATDLDAVVGAHVTTLVGTTPW